MNTSSWTVPFHKNSSQYRRHTGDNIVYRRIKRSKRWLQSHSFIDSALNTCFYHIKFHSIFTGTSIFFDTHPGFILSNAVFWDTKPCSLVQICQRFAGTCCREQVLPILCRTLQRPCVTRSQSQDSCNIYMHVGGTLKSRCFKQDLLSNLLHFYYTLTTPPPLPHCQHKTCHTVALAAS